MDCPVCQEVYAEPRVLPCGHTFCFTCIDRWRGNRLEGQSLSCPYCRQEFILPHELPKNYSVMDILGMTKDDFRRQMASDMHNITTGMEKCREMLERVEEEEKDFIEQLETTKVKIDKEAERLKQIIDDHSEKLMNELSSMKQKRMEKIKSLREEIDRQLVSMESHKSLVDAWSQQGRLCDIAQFASSFHVRGGELLMFDFIELRLTDLGHADVRFTLSDLVFDDVKITLGHVRLCIANRGESESI